MNCKYCNSTNTENRGLQQGVHLPTRRFYRFPIYQCNSCGTSFAFDSDKRFEDDGSLVPAKVVEGGAK